MNDQITTPLSPSELIKKATEPFIHKIEDFDSVSGDILEKKDKSNNVDFGNTVSISIIETVSVEFDGKLETISGPAEPNFDPSYSRQPIKIKRRKDNYYNLTPFEFDSSYDWPGEVIGYVIHDEKGKAIGRYNFDVQVEQQAGMKFEEDAGQIFFEALDNDDNGN